MTEKEKEISGMKDRILVEANVAITELSGGNYAILLDEEHYLCFRTTLVTSYVAVEKLGKVVEANRVSIVKL
jgi:hypothetical protein